MKAPATLDLTVEQIQACLGRIEPAVGPADFEVITALFRAYRVMLQALSAARVSVARLKRLFFGSRTEKSTEVLPKDGEPDPDKADGEKSKGAKAGGKKPRAKGRGRNGVKDYPGAEKIPVPHPEFSMGCACPNEACTGKLYRLKDPGLILRIVGQPPLMARIWEQDRWRCHFCDEIFHAPLPPEAQGPKYAPSAISTIGHLHYGHGLAFSRLASVQKEQGIPLPASTQSELMKEGCEKLLPVFNELKRTAAQGEILHNDDTVNRILSRYKDKKASEKEQETPLSGTIQEKSTRTGTFTTGIVSRLGTYTIALYCTGYQHAGENLRDVLLQRDPALPPPIHMSDGLDHNAPQGIATTEGKCLTHGRRQFVDILSSFPPECRRVIEALGEVYHVDAIAKEQNLSPQERLFLHQGKSGPVMDKLRRYITEQLLEDQVEPNSGLGKAYQYMLKRWEPLTLFLREPGAPLDNNINERILKVAIRVRRNSLFFKTEAGAQEQSDGVGDLFMSLIETCRRNGVESLAYLTALLENASILAENPAAWMPWNYQATLAANASSSPSTTAENSPALHQPSNTLRGPPASQPNTSPSDTLSSAPPRTLIRRGTRLTTACPENSEPYEPATLPGSPQPAALHARTG